MLDLVGLYFQLDGFSSFIGVFTWWVFLFFTFEK